MLSRLALATLRAAAQAIEEGTAPDRMFSQLVHIAIDEVAAGTMPVLHVNDLHSGNGVQHEAETATEPGVVCAHRIIGPAAPACSELGAVPLPEGMEGGWDMGDPAGDQQVDQESFSSGSAKLEDSTPPPTVAPAPAIAVVPPQIEHGQVDRAAIRKQLSFVKQRPFGLSPKLFVSLVRRRQAGEVPSVLCEAAGLPMRQAGPLAISLNRHSDALIVHPRHEWRMAYLEELEAKLEGCK